MEDIIKNKKYKPKDFAAILGVSVKTLQRWDREGILKSYRTLTNRRYYTYEQYLESKGISLSSSIKDILNKDISDSEKIVCIKKLLQDS